MLGRNSGKIGLHETSDFPRSSITMAPVAVDVSPHVDPSVTRFETSNVAQVSRDDLECWPGIAERDQWLQRIGGDDSTRPGPSVGSATMATKFEPMSRASASIKTLNNPAASNRV